MTRQPYLILNDGNRIPQLGFGMWLVTDEEAPETVDAALRVGYRLFDSAQGYENEAGLGEALRRASVAREEIVVTTKVRNRNQGYDSTLGSFEESMNKLGLETLDLLLIHWPLPAQNRYVDTWRAMVRLREEGRVRSIGVSNFLPDYIDRIVGETGVVPAVNQVELHPRYQQRDIRDYHLEHDIRIESWSPLGRGDLLDHPVITGIAKKHGRSAAQVMLRWHLMQGLIVIPKSSNPQRIAENFAVFDFDIDAGDMAAIAGMDDPANGKRGGRPETVNSLN